MLTGPTEKQEEEHRYIISQQLYRIVVQYSIVFCPDDHYITIIIIMWHVKPRVKPVIIGATGTISKSFRKYVSTIPGNHDVKELQKTAILGTAHILRKVLM
jgi:hypothetical protein